MKKRKKKKNEDNNGDFVFSEIVGSLPHSLAKAYDGPGSKANLTSVGGIYSLGNALIVMDGNCLRAFSLTKEQVKMMEDIREGHEAYDLMSSKINPRVKELKWSENFRQ